ncbi:MAG: YfiT family bacillithiol transferase [Saprospiraceae bacterium]
MDTALENLKYPIGRFIWPKEVSDEDVHHAIQTIKSFPGKMTGTVEKLEKGQIDTPYRPEGWTVRQLVHHVADSHINPYVRFKLALTEDNPTIKPYDQTRWAALLDSQVVNPDISLSLITNIHTRWVIIMESMSDADWDRSFVHPEYKVTQSLRQVLMMYSWHCDHHLAHITSLIERMGWH